MDRILQQEFIKIPLVRDSNDHLGVLIIRCHIDWQDRKIHLRSASWKEVEPPTFGEEADSFSLELVSHNIENLKFIDGKLVLEEEK
jgi:hypothetical protein